MALSNFIKRLDAIFERFIHFPRLGIQLAGVPKLEAPPTLDRHSVFDDFTWLMGVPKSKVRF